MARPAQPRQRQRGSIKPLPSGALRVRVYAGVDPVSKKMLYLTEVVPPGPKQAREAEQARTRLLSQVDEKRNPNTRATVDQLFVKYFGVLDVDVQTLRGYESKYRIHIKPLIGSVQLTRLDAEILESFYAELRTCKDHCRGQKYVQHRTQVDHVCDEHRDAACRPPNSDGCRACRRACKPHSCRGLSDSTIRQIHWIVSGALDRAIVWKWISVNPAEHADKPSLPKPDPKPPTADEAAQLINAAFASDPDWGTFIWTKMTTGARRGEMCALRDYHLESAAAPEAGGDVLSIKRALYLDDDGELQEKDTKTHQHRRIVLDLETSVALREHAERAQQRASAIGITRTRDAYTFSAVPDGSIPLKPDTVTQRYARMARKLGIDSSLKNLRAYNATELISAGVDPRTVAGRLGHGGGGATTLKVYTAWSSEADQRAAGVITTRMPPRPGGGTAPERANQMAALPGPVDADLQLYQQIAADLRGAIDSGILMPGEPLPSEKTLAGRYGVAPSTAHRAIAALVASGLVIASRGVRATVALGTHPEPGDHTSAVVKLRP